MVFKASHSFMELIKEIDKIVANLDLSRLQRARWFRKKVDRIKAVELFDYGLMESENEGNLVIPSIISFTLFDSLKNLEYTELYYIPLVISKKLEVGAEVWLEIVHQDYCAFVYDGIHSLSYNRVLEGFIKIKQVLKMQRGGYLKAKLLAEDKISASSPLTDLSSNSLTLVKKEQIIKTYRRVMEGINPDLEINLALTQETKFKNFPQIRGYISYQDFYGTQYDLCLLEEYVSNKGDVWAYTQDYLADYLKYAWKVRDKLLLGEYIRDFCQEMTGLGKLVAELHLALAMIEKPSFKSCKVERLEIEEWYRSVNDNARVLFKRLKLNRDILKSREDNSVEKIINLEQYIYDDLKKIFDLKEYLGKKIRVHGDLHLEQILRTDNDFLILDFEGEPLKSISYRRKKQSPLKDLAGMLRSFNYAAYAGFFTFINQNQVDSDEPLLKAITIWEEGVIDGFLTGYLTRVRQEEGDLLPPVNKFNQVLALFKLEKALYEAIYEINNRPDWLRIPLEGIIDCTRELEGE